jgi:uncharacterized DUF497 family protein
MHNTSSQFFSKTIETEILIKKKNAEAFLLPCSRLFLTEEPAASKRPACGRTRFSLQKNLYFSIKDDIGQTMEFKPFRWNEEKNFKLKEERGVCFEDVVFKIEMGEILDLLEHPNKKRYPNQRIFVVEIDGYAYLVPFVETEEEVFLKTIIPSRKATKKYLRRRNYV